MNNMQCRGKTEGTYASRSSRKAGAKFVLWREVLMAYVSPAVMAGIGGVITANKSLQIGALTTIGGASALIALLIGLWLQNRGRHIRWVARAPRLAVVGIMALTAVLFGFGSAWATTGLLDMFNPSGSLAWLSRVWFDFPMSAAIASILVTWRWRLSNTN